MQLIDNSYFVGEINIPGRERSEIKDVLNNFIAKYETEFLKDIFGYSLWKAYDTGINDVAPLAKWTALRDGVEYTNLAGYPDKWRGLRFTEPVKGSLFANYIFYKWNKDRVTFSTPIGEVKPEADNAMVMSPIIKMVKAWNEMIDFLREMMDFLDAKMMTDYPEWQKQNKFLLTRKYWYINSFGI
jgi:hypothetical protein